MYFIKKYFTLHFYINTGISPAEDIIKITMKININMNGNNNNTHETPDTPALQSKFKIHVQNKTYINLIAKIKKRFGT